MLVHWIWLAARPGVTDRMKVQLLQHFLDPEDLYFADQAALDCVEGLSPEARESLADRELTGAEQILETCFQGKIQILTYRDAAYPRKLKNTADPPIVLYYKGRLPELDAWPVIAVVGTRKASVYGLTTAKRMGYQIGACGGIVVSGMAQGIDAMAMSGALTAGQTVVGVLGCGIDMVYPPSNKALFRDTEDYGCIFSEFPPGTPPAKWTFPKRNRIISGLSDGVLVVEAPEKSGALITARLAAEQGRDVFAVPGNIDMPSFVGSNRLIRDGAGIASSGWDILSEYEALYPDKLRRDESPVHQRAYPDEAVQAEAEPLKVAQKTRKPKEKSPLKKDLDKEAIDKSACAPYSDVESIRPKLSETGRAIVELLQKGERLVDEIIAETGLTTGKILAELTLLELKGVIRRLPGKRIILK